MVRPARSRILRGGRFGGAAGLGEDFAVGDDERLIGAGGGAGASITRVCEDDDGSVFARRADGGGNLGTSFAMCRWAEIASKDDQRDLRMRAPGCWRARSYAARWWKTVGGVG